MFPFFGNFLRATSLQQHPKWNRHLLPTTTLLPVNTTVLQIKITVVVSFVSLLRGVYFKPPFRQSWQILICSDFLLTNCFSNCWFFKKMQKYCNHTKACKRYKFARIVSNFELFTDSFYVWHCHTGHSKKHGCHKGAILWILHLLTVDGSWICTKFDSEISKSWTTDDVAVDKQSVKMCKTKWISSI